jgi:hypothetical protein
MSVSEAAEARVSLFSMRAIRLFGGRRKSKIRTLIVVRQIVRQTREAGQGLNGPYRK